ncbi:methionine biosynthesis protein MetW [Varunaivibrio sulfuroxidans]|uniref:Methionine biosynthesis protein MetW n=1 Tax=Varunaivibrio sulfuroxidans TaxID=1773489 RepID=A0A4R3J774_9PROT|nr:methionine biosynthesis protein MetW [Varunaivibrio sulfuroxidans]TCS61708.1 methionine biosynthesis protein MetW [Varunaivibrio sulfuroxidans]WES32108.1 methionine biosynthesis protein MetW [Varunaivibrio sulfuroxidans]
MNSESRKSIRVDLQIIADMIETGSRVLDVGCEHGALLDYLRRFKRVDGRGIELSTEGVKESVSHGLSVVQGDADTDLKDYPDDAFDYVVLSQTLQAMREPKAVLGHMMRIGRSAIVSFPNFAHWRVRLQLGFRGRMPVSQSMPHQWYETPNIHFCTIRDFIVLCAEMGYTIEQSIALDGSGAQRGIGRSFFLANLLGEQAVFLLKK